MPKIIENLREQIITEAQNQLSEQGYKKTTIRSVAQECGIAVGTVYNYFKSKDILIASLVLEDWNGCIQSIANYPKEDRRAFLEHIHISLNAFEKKHDKLFTDKEASKTFNTVFFERHRLLRSQLSHLIHSLTDDKFLSDFVAEALLCWTTEGKSFEEIYPFLPEQIK
jgi:AcrR family transcriptional regulator